MENLKTVSGLETAINKTENSIIGDKMIIKYRGAVSAFSTAVIAAGTYHLTKTVPELSYRMTNQGFTQNMFMLLGVGMSSLLVPAAAGLLLHEMYLVKENIRMLKVEKKWLKTNKSALTDLLNEQGTMSEQICEEEQKNR